MKIRIVRINENSVYFEIAEGQAVYSAGVTKLRCCSAFHGSGCRTRAAQEAGLWGSHILEPVKFSTLLDYEKYFIRKALSQARLNKKLGF